MNDLLFNLAVASYKEEEDSIIDLMKVEVRVDNFLFGTKGTNKIPVSFTIGIYLLFFIGKDEETFIFIVILYIGTHLKVLLKGDFTAFKAFHIPKSILLEVLIEQLGPLPIHLTNNVKAVIVELPSQILLDSIKYYSFGLKKILLR